MDKTMKDTKIYKLLELRDSVYIPQIQKAVSQAESYLLLTDKVFDTYTIHGISHSVNVVEYMFDLMDSPDTMSDTELAVMIYAALFHDIGMGATQDEIDKIKRDELKLGNRKYSCVLDKYKNEHIALQECVRPVHAVRSAQMIREQLDKNLFMVPDSTTISFREEVALICQAHNEDFTWLSSNLKCDSYKGQEHFNPQYVAMLLRIADYLDMDDQRAPLYLYEYLQPKEYSELEWQQHFCIDNYDKIRFNPNTGLKEVIFCGSSDSPSVHRKLLKYFENISSELTNAVALSESFEDKKYLCHLRTTVVNHISTTNFTISDFKLTLDYRAVSELLMGEHIYGDHKYGLRELVQNSIDACKTMRETSEGMEEFRFRKYEPFIMITMDADRGSVSVLDNGSGMNMDIMKKYFLNVGVSYYKSNDYILQGKKYKPIGHYGIGFLSCFMLSDKVKVISKHVSASKTICLEFERSSEYICLTEEKKPRLSGTEIILEYDSFMQIFQSVEGVKQFMEENFIDSGIPIRLVVQKGGETENISCDIKSLEDELTSPICLNKYLNGIEAYIECNCKGISYPQTIFELCGYECFFYKPEENTITPEAEDARDIRQFVNNGEISFISCCVIEDSEEDFLKAYEVLEDYDEALQKISSYNYVAFMPDKIEDLYLCGDGLVTEEDERIIGDYNFEKFCKATSHSANVPTKIDYKTFSVISNADSKCILPYGKMISLSKYFFFDRNDKTYIKGVLLPKLIVTLPFVVSGVALKRGRFNIENDVFYPTVSRDTMSEDVNKKLGYAIGKALHLWILDNGNLSAEKKSLLIDFIRNCYPENNECLCKDNAL